MYEDDRGRKRSLKATLKRKRMESLGEMDTRCEVDKGKRQKYTYIYSK